MPTMRVSVLIPNRNYGDYLRACIDSALNQTYPNVEIIVYDDGSDDDSIDILRSYGSRITAIEAPNHNKGHAANQVHAINTAFARSQGEIICLLDSDDLFEPGKLARVVETFQQHPDCIAVENFGCYVDAQNNFRKPYDRHLLPFQQHQGLLSSSAIYAQARRTRFPFMGLPTSFLSFRRSFLEQVMPLPEDGSSACFVDLRLSALVPAFGDYCILREPLTRYRVHGNNNFYGRPAGKFIRCMIQSCQYSNTAMQRHTGRGVFFWTSRPMLRFFRIFLRKLKAQSLKRLRN